MGILVALSTVDDGNMLIHSDQTNDTVVRNRERFLAKHRIGMDQTSRVNVHYTTETFCRYTAVSLRHDGGKGMRGDDIAPSDALVTTDTNHALFLPLADCVGVILYDQKRHVLMLSHLGRHSLEQQGGEASVAHLVDHFGCDPADMHVWLTPSPNKTAYPMWKFNNVSMKDVVYAQLIGAGIHKDAIADNSADTVSDTSYFSHSEFLAGRRKTDGRHSIVAMMTA